MAKLARVVLFDDFDPESEDRVLRSRVLTAGKGRTRELTGRVEAVTDMELEDEPANRRVWVSTSSAAGVRTRRFLPYERIRFADDAPPPELKPVAPEKAIPQMVKQAELDIRKGRRGERDPR